MTDLSKLYAIDGSQVDLFAGYADGKYTAFYADFDGDLGYYRTDGSCTGHYDVYGVFADGSYDRVGKTIGNGCPACEGDE